jgi:SAM-dependent methyltransferase
MSTFVDRFAERSAEYARHRPRYPRALGEALAAHAPRASRPRRALDVGAGSGQLSTILGDVFDEVVAIDASAAQLANATPHPRVRYVVAPAERTGLPDATFDLVVAAQAAHWFDLDAFYREVRRVAAEDALVALVSYGAMSLAPPVHEVVEAFQFRVLDGFWPPERKLVDDGYRTLPFPFAELPLPFDGMFLEATWSLDDVLGYVRTWSGCAALAKTGDAGRAKIAAFEAELTARWGDPASAREVRWPLVVRAGRVAS